MTCREPSSEERKRLKQIWRGIKDRCHNPNDHDYKHYHGQGIYVCDEWRESYDAFEQWAMSNGYRQDLTLDRVRQYGPYSPVNCRWISRKQQAYNRSSNKYITIDGHSKTMQEWSDLYGVPKWTICRRIQNGWDAEKAVKTPPKSSKK